MAPILRIHHHPSCGPTLERKEGNRRKKQAIGEQTQPVAAGKADKEEQDQQNIATLCWGCNQTGHRKRDCWINPWKGPAAEKNWDAQRSLRGALLAISTHPQDEPTVPVVIDSTVHPFMVDTGATYSGIGKKGLGSPL